MEGLLTLASVPGERAHVWERFVGPRTIWVAEESADLVGSVSIAERHTLLDHSLTRWGYLGELRVAPGARRRGVALALGRAMAAAERAAQSRFTAFATLGGNRVMEAFIRRSRALPQVAPLARMRLIQWLTLVRPAAETPVETRTASAADIPEMHRLLQEFWDERVLGPVQTLDDFAAQWTVDASMTIDQAVVAVRRGAVVGCGALWDRRPLRREVVLHYRFPLSLVARVVRWYSARRGGSTLPQIGQPLPLAAIRYFAARDLAAGVAIRNRLLALARERGLLIVMLGVDARDPLADVGRGHLRVTIPATLWVGQADRDSPDLSSLLGRPAYVDFSLV